MRMYVIFGNMKISSECVKRRATLSEFSTVKPLPPYLSAICLISTVCNHWSLIGCNFSPVLSLHLVTKESRNNGRRSYSVSIIHDLNLQFNFSSICYFSSQQDRVPSRLWWASSFLFRNRVRTKFLATVSHFSSPSSLVDDALFRVIIGSWNKFWT